MEFLCVLAVILRYRPTSSPFSSLSVHQKPLLSERDVSTVAAMPLRTTRITSPPFIFPTPLLYCLLFASTLFPLLESLALSSLSPPSCFIRLSYFYILQLLMLLLCSSFSSIIFEHFFSRSSALRAKAVVKSLCFKSRGLHFHLVQNVLLPAITAHFADNSGNFWLRLT